MSHLHLRSPFFLASFPGTVFSLNFGIFIFVSDSLALAAAAEAANQNSNDKGTGQHRHGDDQNLEVDPTDPPSSIIQRTHTLGGQNVPHWVVNALFCLLTPQACHILQAITTRRVGFGSTRN